VNQASSKVDKRDDKHPIEESFQTVSRQDS